MNLVTLGSGSAGNCYLLQSENETLILDCGLPVMEIKKGLKFDISKVKAVLVTHCHLDHSKSLAEFQNMGIPCFTPYLTDGEPMSVMFGNFNVQCFPLPHNGTINYGFYIKEVTSGERFLYMTDYEYCSFNFKNTEIQHIFLECNYQRHYVNNDLPNYEHKIRGHSSLDYCKQFLELNKTNALRTVVLLHLGAGSANPKECIDEVKKIVPRANVYVAEKGLTVDLSECPF